MTQNQRRLIVFIARYRERYLDSPTLREMVSGIGVFDNRSVLGILESLEKGGYVTKRGDRRSRGIRLTQKAHELLGLVPIVKPSEIPSVMDGLRRSAPNFVSFTETETGGSPLAVDGTTNSSRDEPLFQAALLLRRFWSGSGEPSGERSGPWWLTLLRLLRGGRLLQLTVSALLVMVVVSCLVGRGLAGAGWFIVVFFSVVLAARVTRSYR